MKKLLGALVVLGIIGYVGHMDYEDAVKQRELYCAKVADGSWPDYQRTYENECVKR